MGTGHLIALDAHFRRWVRMGLPMAMRCWGVALSVVVDRLRVRR